MTPLARGGQIWLPQGQPGLVVVGNLAASRFDDGLAADLVSHYLGGVRLTRLIFFKKN